MNKCILCDGDSGFGMICPECKEAFLHYKKVYFTTKTLTETTDLDVQMFELLYKTMGFGEFKEDSLYDSSDISAIVHDTRNILQSSSDAEWLRQQPDRMNNFLKYVGERLRKDFAEVGK